MYKTSGILILSLFAAIEVTKCEQTQSSIPETLKPVSDSKRDVFPSIVTNKDEPVSDSKRNVFPSMATDKDVESLAEITSKQALPVVVSESSNKQELLTPVTLVMASIKNRRLVEGTVFLTNKIHFLCPSINPSTNEVCLAPKQFEDSQVLECEQEPIPTLEPDPTAAACGPEGAGAKLLFGYSVCPAVQPDKYETTFLTVYTMCYDENKEKILFTDHKINSPILLSEKLLTRERQAKLESESKNKINEKIPIVHSEKKNHYESQFLVPTDDMAFFTYRKVTINDANEALQHDLLITPWNQIRSHLEDYYSKEQSEDFNVMTGVFDIPKTKLSTHFEETEEANIWVTLVLDTAFTPKEGLAILMNNFIVKETQYIDELCGENLCAPYLTKQFDGVGGQVRCCKVTNKISNLFVPKKDAFSMEKVLHIPYIVA